MFSLWLLSFGISQAQHYTWTGNSDTDWSNSSNWDLDNGNHPSTGDTVTIETTSVPPTLTEDITISMIFMLSDEAGIMMEEHTLTVSDSAVFSGTATVSVAGDQDTLILLGDCSSFENTTFDVPVKAICGSILLNGSTFNAYGYFEQNGEDRVSEGEGGNLFGDPTFLVISNSGTFSISESASNTFNGDVTIWSMEQNAKIYLSRFGANFNGNIYFNIMGTGESDEGEIFFGDVYGEEYYSELAEGKVIAAGDSGMRSGSLCLIRFIQNGATEQTLDLQGGVLDMKYCEFNGKLTINSQAPLLGYSTFNDTLVVSQTSNSASVNWSGGNVFNGFTAVTNYSDNNLIF